MKFTIFGSDYTNSRVPKSPFNDLTYIFKTIEFDLKDALKYMSSHFILNRSYTIDQERLRKTKKDLSRYLDDTFDTVILDIDNVETEYAMNMVLNWFKEKDYSVILGPSRGYNGEDKFTLKGVIEAKGNNNRTSIRAILEEIQKGLFGYCKIDLNAINEGAFQAPTYNEEIFLFNKGKYIPEAFLIEEVKEYKIDVSNEKVLDICINHFRMLGFSVSSINEEKGLLQFQHPNEKTKNGYFLFINNPFYMHHFNESKSFNIFNDLKENQVVKDYIEHYHFQKREMELVKSGDSKFSISKNERFLTTDEQTDKFIEKWFNENGLMKIKSPMGTGKSNVISEIIKKSHERNLPVLMVTNRVTVAKDFQKKYNIPLYSEGDYKIGNSLVVQLESLWKYSLRDFEVVILDEFMSLMIHSRNNMSDYSNLNKVKLQFALKTKLCVIADAFLYGDEDNFITTKPKFLINNEFREDIKIFEYPDKETFFQKVIETSLEERGKRKKVSVSCTSKSMADALIYVLESKGLSVMSLSSETSEVDRELIFKEFEKEGHNSWNVLVYTPTLTVGVSILNKCSHHFHYDEGNTADVISSIQMIRRSRKAENIHIFLHDRKRYLETDYKILNSEIKNNISKFYKQTKNSLLIGIDENGDFTLSETGEFINVIEIIYNKLENDHRHSFKLLLQHQVKNKPILVERKCCEVDMKKINQELKEKQREKMIELLKSIDVIEYSDGMLDMYAERNYLTNDKERLLKFMSEIKVHFNDRISEKELARITETEIKSKFTYIRKIKKLFLYQSRGEADLKKLISYIVSEDIVNKNQIKEFNYMLSLKTNSIKLKQTFTMKDIKEINSLIGWGKFQEFLGKVGYKKYSGKYILSNEVVQDAKLIKRQNEN